MIAVSRLADRRCRAEGVAANRDGYAGCYREKRETRENGQVFHGKRADYILRYRPDMPMAVVEAKPTYASPGDGLRQAKADRLKELPAATAAELDALHSSILDMAFKGGIVMANNRHNGLNLMMPGLSNEMVTENAA